MRPISALAPATILSTLLAIVPAALAQQSGYYVLDGFGGVHRGGPVIANSPATPYFGFNIARAIAHRNIAPRANFTSTDTVSST